MRRHVMPDWMDMAISDLIARRNHLDMLIHLIELERPRKEVMPVVPTTTTIETGPSAAVATGAAALTATANGE